jgi:transcriptional regulator of acetoin/glycerol metabolism
MLALCEPGETLGADALPPDVRAGTSSLPEAPHSAPAPSLSTLDAMTMAAMRNALQAAKGNVSLAARILGVSRSTFYRRLQNAL